ncbi:MAG: enoyl-CoA hydratase/isomerase family protein [Rhodospirillaceae bacterium]|jgi:enoyl-CoA hydratase/carnithine racemase|nr:enoyl-CoA hydratase/isomerase family protein [Rhodospirillaceae bacterium]MDD9915133.1 enoyl-CoA hydratase/isomerase family protein [Rhodospirillaceae bacterium]MDD9929027.1 enoyl-CoA hydratase/isomerase family protein [Rhodospirillaceae bacterium]|tara:strand:- start:28 stop:822 length:795 start_codon:yes stop_codon:yes gene_type:complete
MANYGPYDDIEVTVDNFVATVEIQRPPFNYFDYALIQQIADAFEAFDNDTAVRSIVLCAQGKAFCAGANFGDRSRSSENSDSGNHLYVEAVRLFKTGKPVVGAMHGAAVGGGLGLAMMPDFRVGCPESRFSANFTRLGFHPGFGLTYTLPRLIGEKNAELMFYTSRRVKGEEAYRLGLIDALVPQDEVRSAAQALATEIAESSPLGVTTTRATMRVGIADKVREATDIELEIQNKLRVTKDFQEGVKAMAERRVPNFTGTWEAA